jgi:hypothetical protein
MPRAVFRQRRRHEVSPWLVRWRRAGVVAINAISQKQKEIGSLATHRFKDGISADALAASALTAEIPTPFEGQRRRGVDIRQSGQFPSCDQYWFNVSVPLSLAYQDVIPIPSTWIQILKANRERKIELGIGDETGGSRDRRDNRRHL